MTGKLLAWRRSPSPPPGLLWGCQNCPSPVASMRKLNMGPVTLPRPGRWPWRLSEVLELVPRTRRLVKLCLEEPGFPLASQKNALVHSISWGHLKESEALVVQPCITDPMDYSLPVTPVHGILQARILVWAAISSSRGILDQGLNPRLLCLLHWPTGSLPFISATWEAQYYVNIT